MSKLLRRLNTQLVKEDIKLRLERQKGRFTLSIGSKSYQQNVCEFILTISFLTQHNTEAYLLDPSSSFDFVRVPLKGNGLALNLTLTDFARLRTLYHEQMYLLKLEDMLLRQGVSLAHL